MRRLIVLWTVMGATFLGLMGMGRPRPRLLAQGVLPHLQPSGREREGSR
jgi:hypothetical protein